MYEVESIKKKKYSKKYFINFKDNTHEYILLDLDTLTKNSISVGVKLSEVKIKSALNDQIEVDVKQKAYSFVSYKPRSEYEVRKRLKEKEFDNKAINIAIQFLYKYKLLDDKKFTRLFVQSYLERKPSGRFKLENELKKKGISEDLISESIKNIYEEYDSYELALIAGKKHQRKIHYKPKTKQKELLIAFLKRRGFRWETIRQVIDKLV